MRIENLAIACVEEGDYRVIALVESLWYEHKEKFIYRHAAARLANRVRVIFEINESFWTKVPVFEGEEQEAYWKVEYAQDGKLF